jgi:hypothetical protein
MPSVMPDGFRPGLNDDEAVGQPRSLSRSITRSNFVRATAISASLGELWRLRIRRPAFAMRVRRERILPPS